jgi:hypothetical protein
MVAGLGAAPAGRVKGKSPPEIIWPLPLSIVFAAGNCTLAKGWDGRSLPCVRSTLDHTLQLKDSHTCQAKRLQDILPKRSEAERFAALP